jgi:hypothetical protein
MRANKNFLNSTKTTYKCSVYDKYLFKIDHIQIIEFTLRLAVLARYEFHKTCGIVVAEFLG